MLGSKENAGEGCKRFRMENAVSWVERLLEQNCWTTMLERDAPQLSGRRWKTVGAIWLSGCNRKSMLYSASGHFILAASGCSHFGLTVCVFSGGPHTRVLKRFD